MESVRVRGCAGREGTGSRQRALARPVGKPMPVAGETVHVTLAGAAGAGSTVRLRSKSCRSGVVRHDVTTEKAGSGGEAARASAGGCGVEDQVGRTDSSVSSPEELLG